MLIYTPPSTANSIPVIDLADSYSTNIEKRKSVAWEIHKACRTTGFFYIKNHSVPNEVIEGQLQLAREFFSLPLEKKLEIDFKNSNCFRGYEPIATQTLDEGSPSDLKEGFMMGKDLPTDHPYVRKGLPQHGSNQWPNDYPKFKAQSESYMKYMLELGKHLAGLVALSLNQSEDYFADGYDEAVIITRMLHYPSQSSEIINNQLGCGAHTDWGLLTLLLQDEVGGLEVRNSDGEWIRAPHIQNTFVVNLGDLLQLMTGNLYLSNMHRVFNSKPNISRYSVPTFFDLDYLYKVKQIPSLQKDSSSNLPEMTVGEYMEHMYQKTFSAKSKAI